MSKKLFHCFLEDYFTLLMYIKGPMNIPLKYRPRKDGRIDIPHQDGRVVLGLEEFRSFLLPTQNNTLLIYIKNVTKTEVRKQEISFAGFFISGFQPQHRNF